MQSELYIDGQWVKPVKGGSFEVINPATEEVIHHAPAGTAEDVDIAVKAARRAFDNDGLAPENRQRACRTIFAPSLRASDAPTGTRTPRSPRQRQAVAGSRLGPRGRRRLLRLLCRPCRGARQQSGRADRPGRFPLHLQSGQGTARRRRRHHTLELSAADGRLEGRPRTCGRLHYRPQARGTHLTDSARARRDRR